MQPNLSKGDKMLLHTSSNYCNYICAELLIPYLIRKFMLKKMQLNGSDIKACAIPIVHCYK